MKILYILTLMMLLGCEDQAHTTTSYNLKKEYVANVGESIIVYKSGVMYKITKWVGVFHSIDGWKTEIKPAKDFVKKELVYAGKSGTTIELNYREFKGENPLLGLYQTVHYDLKESKIINFKKYKIEITTANNQIIKFKVLNDM